MSKFLAPSIIDGYMFANITNTPTILMDKMNTLSVHAFCTATGSPVGTLYVQVSNEPGDPVVNGVASNINNWATLTSFAISGATNIYWQGQVAAKWVQLEYVATSGTGALYVYAFGKSFNG